MTQLPWHDYAGESADDLFALSTTHRADSLVVAFETALGQKAASLGTSALTQPELDVLAIEGLEREVNNGGYEQFFLNSSNEFAGIVVEALQRIGCLTTASITQRAIAALPTGTVLTPDSLSATMVQDDPSRDRRLEECDQAYFDAEEDIATALLRYLIRQRESVELLRTTPHPTDAGGGLGEVVSGPRRPWWKLW
jgi:hypothetical protein